jgi:16S rRNA (uracil1498-N3)-methyltransferase
MTPRLFVAEPFAAGATVVLPPAALRHVQALRLARGDALVLFNGSDGADWPGELVEIGRGRAAVCVGAAVAVDRELGCAVTLAIGVPANDRMDALVEKAGELGATAIQPLVCARSVLRLAGERAEVRRRHWQAVAVSASEQCGRARVATVLPIAPFAAWLRSPAANAAATRIVLSFDRFALDPATAWSGAAGDAARAAAIVLSGPEGGLEPAEEDAAAASGFVRVGLGPRVLRADTAPLAWLAWLGVHELARASAAR